MTEAQKQAMEFLDEMRRNGMPDVIYESERRALLGDSADASPEAAPSVEPASAPTSQSADVSSALEWYVATNNQQKAQVSRERLEQMLRNEEITRQNLVWKQGIPGNNWTPIEKVDELQDMLAKLPPPMPSAPVVETVPSVPTMPVVETVPSVPTMPPIQAAPIAANIQFASPDTEERFRQANNLYNNEQYDEAVPILQTLANEGYAAAQFLLGDCYKYGDGIEGNESKATEWYRKAIESKAAEQGNADAQYGLGNCFSRGNVVQEDLTKAVEWYHKAAEQGQADAQYKLGTCYHFGDGVKPDLNKAAEWYRKAADQGNDTARESLDSLMTTGFLLSNLPSPFPATVPSTPSVSVSDKGKRVLLVAAPLDALTLNRALKSEGFTILAQDTDGAKGVEKYKKLYPNIDVVLLGLSVTGMNGLSALQKIIEFDKNARVIMILASETESNIRIALETGAKSYLVYPKDKEKLSEKISSVLK